MTIGIVLGGGLTRTGTVPLEVKKRIDCALPYLEHKDISKLICSGGYTREGVHTSEAAAMKKYAVKRGADESRIVLEENSLETIGNALFTRAMIPSGVKVVIFTSKSHMKRALMIFRNFFSDVTGVSCNPPMHHIWNWLREFELREAEKVILNVIPKKDMNTAIKILLEHMPMYRRVFKSGKLSQDAR